VRARVRRVGWRGGRGREMVGKGGEQGGWRERREGGGRKGVGEVGKGGRCGDWGRGGGK